MKKAMKQSASSGAPITSQGLRRPQRVRVLSERKPYTGLSMASTKVYRNSTMENCAVVTPCPIT